MKKRKEKLILIFNQNEKGITLVALVITIIILIILATVSINAAFGDNGLLEQAEKTKGMATNSITKENEDLNKLEQEYANVMAEDDEIEKPDNPREVEGVTIPDGFYYVGGSKSEGIVISDKKEDLKKGTSHEVAQTLIGNQFVWIPVEDDSLFQRYEGYDNGEYGDTDFAECREPFLNGYTNEQAEYDEMKANVLKHNGFYVGRYEAGINSDTPREEGAGITDPVVIKQGKKVYNYVGWSNSNDMTNELGGAVELSKNFDAANGYTSVTSALIYGIEWDAIINFIDPAYSTGNCDTSSSAVANSTGKGNYDEAENTNPWKGQLTTTGASSDYAIKNIYDIGGNVAEWTMEANTTNKRVDRGRTL